jgi:predicted RNase H-like HicB family nuclease
MSPSRYSVFIAWSEADEAYIAKVFELPGCMAHGDTRAEAIAQVEVATENWLDTARELGRAVPEPRHLESYEKELDAKAEQSAQELEAVWEKGRCGFLARNRAGHCRTGSKISLPDQPVRLGGTR